MQKYSPDGFAWMPGSLRIAIALLRRHPTD
jgi:hypothetical protein